FPEAPWAWALAPSLALPLGAFAGVKPDAAPDPGAAVVPGAVGAVPLGIVPLLALPPGTGTATLAGCSGRNVCPSRSANPLPSVGFFWLITLDHNESGAPVTVFAALTQVRCYRVTRCAQLGRRYAGSADTCSPDCASPCATWSGKDSFAAATLSAAPDPASFNTPTAGAAPFDADEPALSLVCAPPADTGGGVAG